MNEQEFLAGYDPRDYPAVAVTVDVVALTIREGALHLLLVRRGAPPFEGHWALPGGFVRPEEDLAAGARRELAEETGLGGERLRRLHLEQLASYGVPDRDPRMRVVSVAHLAFAPDLPDPAAGSDADEALWLPVSALASRQLAFDHARVIEDGLERARSKLEYTPLATRFLDAEFTVTELRGVYETVWGHPLHPGNFHRKVLSVPGFVESTGASTERGGTRGGPRAKLYRAGDARLLHPALLRPAREETVR
ncbi:Bifunctional NMN adenylyltransferase/Nudix hydrolase [Micromonospora sp. MW-13]|uniref:NUDIX hydrolase n=1 Tax=unclassified Micromonospora TaxID=2617518 RepID=UPI000E4395CD|nr:MULTISPECIES: NUDIX domain-containing protein [unclassified Micromonospora]MCX4469017.1 NUDIX hydrolase [Micromonospora sp. NBC_01655]RGC69032.1 Bifunctional NMN adenylyltransferase/Nudix hydrolase [Micromonospora sp. MW-13]